MKETLGYLSFTIHIREWISVTRSRQPYYWSNSRPSATYFSPLSLVHIIYTVSEHPHIMHSWMDGFFIDLFEERERKTRRLVREIATPFLF